MITAIEIPIGDGSRPLTINTERKENRFEARRQIVHWRELAGWAAKEHGLTRLGFDRVEFHFTPVYKSGNLPDTGAIFPVEKAIIDGFVEVGVIPDDNSSHNAGQMSRPPTHGEETLVRVEIRPVEPSPHKCACRVQWERQQMANQMKSRRGGRRR